MPGLAGNRELRAKVQGRGCMVALENAWPPETRFDRNGSALAAERSSPEDDQPSGRPTRPSCDGTRSVSGSTVSARRPTSVPKLNFTPRTVSSAESIPTRLARQLLGQCSKPPLAIAKSRRGRRAARRPSLRYGAAGRPDRAGERKCNGGPHGSGRSGCSGTQAGSRGEPIRQTSQGESHRLRARQGRWSRSSGWHPAESRRWARPAR